MLLRRFLSCLWPHDLLSLVRALLVSTPYLSIFWLMVAKNSAYTAALGYGGLLLPLLLTFVWASLPLLPFMQSCGGLAKTSL